MKPLSTIDSFCLYADAPHAGLHGAFLQVYAGRPGESTDARFKRLRKHIERSLDAAPVFRRRIERAPFEMDRALWVDGGEVDLDYHVRRTALPRPGNDKQLAAAYARIYAESMDMTRPLWEIHVIDGIDASDRVPANSFALVAKFHHAGVDGVTGVDITSALHSSEPGPARTNLKPQKARRKTRAEQPPELAGWMMESARFYTRLGKTLATHVPAISTALLNQFRTQPKQKKSRRQAVIAPRSVLNGMISNSRSFTWQAVSLDDIKRIRQAVPGATVNDVYLAICAGALRLTLADTNDLPRSSLVAACPVNIRTEEEKGQGGNKFSLMRVPLATREANALKRLQKIAAFTGSLKSSMGDRGGARKSMAWLEMLPAPLLALVGAALRSGRLAARMAPIVNLIVTNVPGPRDTIYLDGYELVDICGVPPVVDGAGLIIGTTSYRNELRIAVGACKKIMPDAEKMRAALQASTVELLALAARQTSKEKTAAQRKAVPDKPAAKKIAKPIVRVVRTSVTVPRGKSATTKAGSSKQGSEPMKRKSAARRMA